MGVKQYLQQAYRLNELISSNLEELKKIHDLSESITAFMSGERVRGGRKNDRTACLVAKMVDLENEINEEIEEFIDVKMEIRETIKSLKNGNQQLVLQLRYIEFLSWEEIAEKMAYSLIQVKRIHNRAIRRLNIQKKDDTK